MAPSWAAVTVSVDHGGASWPVDVTAIDTQIEASSNTTGTGRATYVASVAVPIEHTDLTVTDQGITSHFDLSTLTPGGGAVLDRAATTPSVVVTPGTTSTVTVTAADGFSEPVTVNLEWATLGAYTVTDPGQPPGLQPVGSPPPDGFAPSAVEPVAPGTAVLDVAFGADVPSASYGQPNWGHFLAAMAPLPGSDVTFTPAGGRPIAAQLVNQVAPGDQTADNGDAGLLDAIYRFDIPDTTTSGTVSIAAASTTGSEFTGFEANGTTAVAEAGGVSDPLTFPPVPPAGPARAIASLPWAGLLSHGTDGAPVGAPTHPAPGGHGFVLVLGVGLLVVVVAALWHRRRSKRRAIDPPAATEPDHHGVPNPVGADEPVPFVTEPPEPPPSPAPSDPAVPSGTGDDSPPHVLEPPAIGEPGDLVVRLFGTPGAEGWVQPPQRRDAVELVCLLATRQGRPLRAEEIVVALGAGDLDGSDRSPKTLMNALSALRRSVGAHRLPDATTAGGYRLLHVATDWDTFRNLAAAGDDAERSGDHRAAIDHHRRALILVQGRPFDGVPEGQYRWAYAEHLVTDMTAAVVDVAHRLATALLAAGRPAEARDAARQGLRGAPDDSVLWEDLARAVEATGEPDAAARFWRSARLALGDPAVTELRSRVGVATDR